MPILVRDGEDCTDNEKDSSKADISLVLLLRCCPTDLTEFVLLQVRRNNEVSPVTTSTARTDLPGFHQGAKLCTGI